VATQHRVRASLGLVAAAVLLLIATACGAQTSQQRFVYFPRPAPAGPAVEEPPPADPPPDASAAEVADAPTLDGATPRLVQPGPAAPRPPARLPNGAIGRVEIPKIGLSHPVYEGISLDQINQGPSHWPGTAAPGQKGNSVFAGHRVTHSHPFLDIDLLQPGDQIIFTTAAGRFVYQVTESLIVTPDATWIADQTPDPTLTLFACHPKHQKTHRYVVRGQLVSAQLAAPPPAPSQPAPPPRSPPPPPPPRQSSPPPSSPPTTSPGCRGWVCLRR
jgi:sortase A